MFNLECGEPVAYMEGTGDKPRLVYLLKEGDENYNEQESNELYDPFQIASEIIYGKDKQRRYLSDNDTLKLEEAIERGKSPKDWKLEKLYNEVQELLKERKGKEFFLQSGTVYPVPLQEEDQNERLYVSGPAGAGKSTYINKWLQFKLGMDPDTKIFVFSKLDEDKSLEKDIGDHIQRVTLDEQLVEKPMSSTDFPYGSVIIFDDIDTIKNEKVLNSVRKLRDDLLETGRHEMLSIITVSHTLMAYSKTKISINECTSTTLFPRAGNSFQAKRYLKEYMGFSPQMVDKCIKLKSRWFTIFKRYPTYCIHEHGAFIID